jgi:hypothetical protein
MFNISVKIKDTVLVSLLLVPYVREKKNANFSFVHSLVAKLEVFDVTLRSKIK